MSFGFGLGDIISLGCLSWNVYQACKEVPSTFRQLSQDVLSLNAVLKETEEAFREEDLTDSRQENLKIIVTGCRGVLEDLQELLKKYERVGRKTNNALDRIGWAAAVDIPSWKHRLTSNTLFLNAFLNSSRFMIEKRLKRFSNELQEGLREESIIASQSDEIVSAEEKEPVWQQFKKELEGVGIKGEDFNANKDFIIDWIKKAIKDGMFEELVARRRSRIVSSIAASTDVGMNHIKIGNPIIIAAIAPQDSVSRPRSTIIEEKIPVVPSPAPRSSLDNPSAMNKPIHLASTIKPQARLLSRRARIMNKVTNPLVNYDKDMIDAVVNNKVHEVRPLLKHADPTVAYKGSTAVEKAIEHSSTGILQIFLENGVHVDHEVRPDETALLVAIKSRKIDVIKVLLAYGADVNLSSRKKATPLLLAAENSRDDIVRLLLERGAQANLASRNGQRALHIAASRKDLRSTLLLLESGAQLDLRDDRGRTALMLAAAEGHTKLCTLLLGRGADAYLCDNAGLTALTYAARNGDIETCTELLSEGREFTSVNPAEVCQIDMALFFAARVSVPKKHRPGWRCELATLLLQHGANINSSSGKQNTALHEAASHNSLSLIELFLAKGGEINAINEKGQTPLHLAARNGQTSTLYVLIQKGAGLVADKEGRTALHHAVLSKKPETLRALMGLVAGSGPKMDTKDKHGMTALELAVRQGAHPNILRVLQGRPWVEDDTGR